MCAPKGRVPTTSNATGSPFRQRRGSSHNRMSAYDPSPKRAPDRIEGARKVIDVKEVLGVKIRGHGGSSHEERHGPEAG